MRTVSAGGDAVFLPAPAAGEPTAGAIVHYTGDDDMDEGEPGRLTWIPGSSSAGGTVQSVGANGVGLRVRIRGFIEGAVIARGRRP